MNERRHGRFLWLGLLMFLPVLVLAALAALGLRAQRGELMALAHERAQTYARSFRDAIEAKLRVPILPEPTSLADIAGSLPQARPVRLFPDPPLPGPETENFSVFVRARERNDLEVLKSLCESDELTPAGLPIAVLAAWEVFQRSPDAASAETLLRLALVTHPSAITPALLERADLQMHAPRAPDWRAIWERDQHVRAFLRAFGDGPVEGSVAFGDGPPSGRLADEAADGAARGRAVSSAGVSSFVTFRNEVWWLAEAANGAIRVLDPTELRDLVRDTQAAVAGRPSWAAVSVRHGSYELTGTSLPDNLPVLASLNEPPAVAVMLEDPDRLFDPWKTQLWWAIALLGTAVGASAAGLALTRRALWRERRLNELKSQFVSSVSHELRAPVASLRLMADALASGKITGAAAADFFRLMVAEGTRLSGLIENLLDFARIEQGRKTYVFEETDVASLAADTVRLFEPQAASRKIRLEFEFEPLPVVPRIDAAAVQQAIVNLLDNALKFSPDGSTVAVKVAPDVSGGSWAISVRDQGRGIPKAEHRRIFERFYRLGNELRRETQGAGIGLSLVRHIVEGHGGRVEVRSAPGEGSVFSLVFPMATPRTLFSKSEAAPLVSATPSEVAPPCASS